MGKAVTRGKRAIRPDMTVLDVLSRFRHTEAVFSRYDNKAGECICCNGLFEPLKDLAAKYDLNLDSLLEELEASLGSDRLSTISCPRNRVKTGLALDRLKSGTDASYDKYKGITK